MFSPPPSSLRRSGRLLSRVYSLLSHIFPGRLCQAGAFFVFFVLPIAFSCRRFSICHLLLKRFPAKTLLQKREPIGKNPIRHIKSEPYLRQAVDWHQLTRAVILQITSFPHRIAKRLSFRHNNPSMISPPADFFPFLHTFPLSLLSLGLSEIFLLRIGMPFP